MTIDKLINLGKAVFSKKETNKNQNTQNESHIPPQIGEEKHENDETLCDSKDDFDKFIKTVTSGQFPISEEFINNLIKDKTNNEDYKVEINDGFFTLKTPKIEADMEFHSTQFDKDTKPVTFKILNLRPFYYKLLVDFIGLKMPYLTASKDVDKTKLITCHLNKIPSLKDWSVINNDYIEDLSIEWVKCEKGNATVKLKVNWWSLMTKIKHAIPNWKKPPTIPGPGVLLSGYVAEPKQDETKTK